MLYGPEHFHILIIEVYIIISFLDKISEKKCSDHFKPTSIAGLPVAISKKH